MRYFCVVLLAFFLVGCSRTPSTSNTEPSTTSTESSSTRLFNGARNRTNKFKVRLDRNGDELTATFYSPSGKPGGPPLKGTMQGEQAFILTLPAEIWRGRFVDARHVQGEVEMVGMNMTESFELEQIENDSRLVASTKTTAEDFSEEDDDTGPNTGVGLQADAMNQAKSYWKKRMAHCNGSFYWVNREKGRPMNAQDFYECKNEPTVDLNGGELPARDLSEADKLNGIDPRPVEWQGKGTFTFNTCRHHYVGESTWRAWENTHNLKFRVRRIKGKWVVDEITPNDINLVDVYEIDCSFVQQYLTTQKL